MKGIVKSYNTRYGYGFIKGEDGKETFVHKSEIPFWTIFLKPGDKVEFIQKCTKKGIIATGIKIIQ